MDYNIEVNNVSKQYNGTNVLDSVNFQIRPGEVFGLLGLPEQEKLQYLRY